MNCPRCKTTIKPFSNPDGIVTCPGCGSRLMTRQAALRSHGAQRAAAAQRLSAPALDSVPPPLPDAVAVPAREPPTSAKARVPSPAGTGADPPAAVVSETGAAAARPVGFELLLQELRAVKALQERILGLLEQGAVPDLRAGAEENGAPLSAIRARRSKTVVLIDDDPATREAALAELQQAEVPVRAFADGNSALSAIADEKPDVIVLELGIDGEMAGKDLINMIRATMEWVDVPIVLWTREAVSNQREARQIHGADEIVAKSSGAAALVARVITVFRRVH